MVARNIYTNKGVVKFDFSILKHLNPDIVILKKYRNNILLGSKKAAYIKKLNTYRFIINDKVEAGLHNYKYELWYDNKLIKKAEQVCCGDFYIIDGQSNAEAMMQSGSSSADCDNYIRTYANAAESNINKVWSIATGDGTKDTAGHVGQLGIALAKDIVIHHHIPVCILNGAVGGKDIKYFLRDESNKENLLTAYGRLYTRVKEADALHNIRAIIWYQGENDAYAGTSYETYLARNQMLYASWKEDYKNVENIYFFQLKSGCSQSIKNTGAIQQAQLDMKNSHSDIDIVSTTNVAHSTDNCHFNYIDGYKVLGNKMYNLINYYQYNSADRLAACSPAVSAVCRKGKTKLYLKVQTAAPLILNKNVKQDFYLNKTLQKPSDVEVSGDTIQLFFENEIDTDDSISYSGHAGVSVYTIATPQGNALLCFYGMGVYDQIQQAPNINELPVKSVEDIDNNSKHIDKEKFVVEPPVPSILNQNADSIVAYIYDEDLYILSKYNRQLSGNYRLYNGNGKLSDREFITIFPGTNIMKLDLAVKTLYIVYLNINTPKGITQKEIKVIR